MARAVLCQSPRQALSCPGMPKNVPVVHVSEVVVGVGVSWMSSGVASLVWSFVLRQMAEAAANQEAVATSSSRLFFLFSNRQRVDEKGGFSKGQQQGRHE